LELGEVSRTRVEWAELAQNRVQ